LVFIFVCVGLEWSFRGGGSVVKKQQPLTNEAGWSTIEA